MVTGSNFTSARRDVEAVLKPDPRRFASRILGWIICWPWDLLGALIVNNPFKLVLGLAVTEIRAAFDDITSGEFKGIEQDLMIDSVPTVAAEQASAERHESQTAPTETFNRDQRSIAPLPVSMPVRSSLSAPAPSHPLVANSLALSASAPISPDVRSTVIQESYPMDDPWYAPMQTSGQDDGSQRPSAVWTPPQIRVFGQPSQN